MFIIHTYLYWRSLTNENEFVFHIKVTTTIEKVVYYCYYYYYYIMIYIYLNDYGLKQKRRGGICLYKIYGFFW
jgi:hypothetical protein